jgi:hypothetical protein
MEMSLPHKPFDLAVIFTVLASNGGGLGLADGLELGEALTLGDTDGLELGDTLALGEAEALGLADGLSDGETLVLGLADGLGETEDSPAAAITGSSLMALIAATALSATSASPSSFATVKEVTSIPAMYKYTVPASKFIAVKVIVPTACVPVSA